MSRQDDGNNVIFVSHQTNANKGILRKNMSLFKNDLFYTMETM